MASRMFTVNPQTIACCVRINSGVTTVNEDHLCFPMMVKINGRTCVVVGAGKIALGKIRGLLECGARVVVISPRAVRPIQELARAELLLWRRTGFSAGHLTGAFLAIAATNSPAANRAVYRASAARGILCNSVDDPPHCDFFYPAVARRGSLQIAVSTGGRSPALAARLRRDLELQFGEEWAEWVEHLGSARRQLLAAKIPEKERRRRLMQQVTNRAFQAFLRRSGRTGRTAGAPAAGASKKTKSRLSATPTR